MATLKLALSTLTAGVSTRANLITYFNANMAILDDALMTNSGSDFNAGLGHSENYTNTAFGVRALDVTTTGYWNVGVGFHTLLVATTGNSNVAIGYNALCADTTGSQNTAVGSSSMISCVTGSHNTAVGNGALCSNTGSGNTAIGDCAGYAVTTGSNLTLVGCDAAASAVGATNEVTLGNFSVTTLRCATTTITAISDVRDKTNIADLDLGLEFLKSLKPRKFTWQRRSTNEDGSLGEPGEIGADEAGFIAQELDTASQAHNADWLGLVMKANPDRWETTPGKLLPIMVKAIQDLATENEGLRARIATLENS